MTVKFFATMAFVSGITIAAGAANAASFNMTWTGVPPYGYPGNYGWTTFETRSDLSSGQVQAGAFLLEGTYASGPSFEFTAFTTEIENALLYGKDYDETSSPFTNGNLQQLDAQRVTDIQSLFDFGNPMSTDLTSIEFSAGFQLALFEIVYEQPSAALYDLDSQFGSSGFWAAPTDPLNADQVAAVAYGNSLLDAINSGSTGTGSNVLTFLESADYTDPALNRSDNLISANFPAPIPLPGSGLFLIAGAGAFAVAKRRRKHA